MTELIAEVAINDIELPATCDVVIDSGGGGGGGNYQVKSVTYTPSGSQQTDEVTPGTGYDALSKVNVTVNAAPVGTAGIPSASKGAVNNHSISVTPTVTNFTGWITGSTKTGIPVTVSASELVSGNKAITANGDNIDVTNYETVSVNVSGGGGLPATHIKTLTVTENVNAFQFEYDSAMAAYNYVFMLMNFELTASDWLYYSADGGAERYGNQMINHKFILFKFINGQNYINLCIPTSNASSSSPASPMLIPSVGSMVKIRCYNASKYIKAGSTLDIWGMNNADF